MPIYEYGCAACGHEFEEWQKINDPPVQKCPACGKRKVHKLVSMSSFHLKGGGWYADLYGSSSKSSKASGANGKSTESSSKPSTSDKTTQPAKTAASSPSPASTTKS